MRNASHRPLAPLAVLPWAIVACGSLEIEPFDAARSMPTADAAADRRTSTQPTSDANRADARSADTTIAPTDASSRDASRAADTVDVSTSGWPDPPPRPSRTPSGTWIRVRAGTFTMGVIDGDACYRTTNEDRHDVTLTHDFEMPDTEVTQGQYLEVMGSNPSSWRGCGLDCPVEIVDWHEAAAYSNALSRSVGLPVCYDCRGSGPSVVCTEVPAAEGSGIYDCPGYRLPSEAEWEFAYRAGTRVQSVNGPLTTCFELDPDLASAAWYLRNAGNQTHPVRTRVANAWGFFDMAGNVWEWTNDRYVTSLGSARVTDPSPAGDPTLRVQRGGSYNCLPYETRGSHRSGLPLNIRGSNVGFRVARTLFSR